MILITGGACQGKCEFLMRHWNIAPEEICDMAEAEESAVGNESSGRNESAVGNEPAVGIRAVVHYQEAVRTQLEQGKDPAGELRKLAAKRPGLILAADEVGMGIVPLEREDRDFREAVGRTMCLAAQMADEVWRVICGIPERIK